MKNFSKCLEKLNSIKRGKEKHFWGFVLKYTVMDIIISNKDANRENFSRMRERAEVNQDLPERKISELNQIRDLLEDFLTEKITEDEAVVYLKKYKIKTDYLPKKMQLIKMDNLFEQVIFYNS